MMLAHIQKYDKLIKKVAKQTIQKHQSSILDEEDLYAEGCLVLDKILAGYKEERGSKVNYLIHCLRNEFAELINKHTNNIALSRRGVYLLSQYRTLCKTKNIEDIAKELGTTEGHLRKLIGLSTRTDLAQAYKVENLDYTIDKKTFLLKNDEILLNFYLGGHTIKEIAKRLGRSDESTRLELKKIFNKLKLYWEEV